MYKICALIVLLAGAFDASASEAPAGADTALNCAIGPKEKILGKTQWLLYGCEGATTAIIVSAPGNPASPFYFAVSRNGGGYRISGEGTGSKTASGAALKDLQALSPTALADLVKQAAHPKP